MGSECTEPGGKATASPGQASWRGAFGRGAAISHPQTAERKTPYLSLLLSSDLLPVFPLAEPSWNPEDKEVHTREQSQAGGEGSGSGGRMEGIQTMLTLRREESYCALCLHLV